MNCINHYIGLGEAPVSGEALMLPLVADVTGTWAFMTTFNGAYQYVQFLQQAGQSIVVPAKLNEDYTYVFKLYKPDNTVLNDAHYCVKTIPAIEGALNICDANGVVTNTVTTGRKQFEALEGQDMVSYTELVNAKQLAVFIEGAIKQEGIASDEYLFDKVNGIVSFNTPLQNGQKITILYFK